MNKTFRTLVGLLLGMAIVGPRAVGADKNIKLPENLARKALATATSEYSGNYLARFAVDGKVPEAGGRGDVSRAWCVQGDTAGGTEKCGKPIFESTNDADYRAIL